MRPLLLDADFQESFTVGPNRFQTRNDVITVAPTGTSGDDTAALQAAVDNPGSTLVMLPGDYVVSSPVLRAHNTAVVASPGTVVHGKVPGNTSNDVIFGTKAPNVVAPTTTLAIGVTAGDATITASAAVVTKGSWFSLSSPSFGTQYYRADDVVGAVITPDRAVLFSFAVGNTIVSPLDGPPPTTYFFGNGCRLIGQFCIAIFGEGRLSRIQDVVVESLTSNVVDAAGGFINSFGCDVVRCALDGQGGAPTMNAGWAQVSCEHGTIDKCKVEHGGANMSGLKIADARRMRVLDGMAQGCLFGGAFATDLGAVIDGVVDSYFVGGDFSNNGTGIVASNGSRNIGLSQLVLLNNATIDVSVILNSTMSYEQEDGVGVFTGPNGDATVPASVYKYRNVVDNSPLLAPHDRTLPPFGSYNYENLTGQTVTLKAAGRPGFTVANGKRVTTMWDGTDHLPMAIAFP